MAKQNTILYLVLFLVAAFFTKDVWLPYLQTGAVAGPGGQQITISNIEDYALNGRAKNYVNGSTISGGVSYSVLDSGKELAVAASAATAYPHAITTALPVVSGYSLVGQDDGADDYYYNMMSFNVESKQNVNCAVGTCTLAVQKPAREGTAMTFYTYDANTLETTWNITVGTTKITNVDIEIESPSDSCIGNPSIPDGVGVCINGTTANLAYFNEIKVSPNKGTFTAPSFASAAYPVLKCYVLGNAVCDGAKYALDISIDPISNPGVTVAVDFVVMDKNYFLNDDGQYVIGWEDSSDLVADADIGLTVADGNAAIMYFT